MNKNHLIRVKREFDVYVSLYNINKYPTDIYKIAKSSFSSLKPNEKQITEALNWKYGNLGKSNYPDSHKLIIKEVVNSWKHFVSSSVTKSPKDTFHWWKERLSKGKFGRYITIAFITHLIHNKKGIPIIDQHNFRAMNYFMNNSVLSPNAKKNPSNWEDIECLKIFISEISKSFNKRNEDVDKFLMMFGKELKKK